MKNFFAAMIMAVSLIICSQASAQNFICNYDFAEVTTGSYAQGVVDYDIDFLALRSGPSRNYPELLRIPPGARVEITLRMGANYSEQGYRNYDNNFRPVTYRGVSGYAHSGYITVIPGTTRDIP